MKGLIDWTHITFAHPYFFGLILLVPFLIWWEISRKRRANPSLRLTTLQGVIKVSPSWRPRLRPVMVVLRVVALVSLIVALARPQSSNTSETVDSEGIDIVLALDVSGSMLAEDFSPNRVEAAKKVALDFIDQRPTDRIGLVIFAGESFTQCPVTIDHNVLKEQVASVKSGVLVDGTAIGDGLATAVDRLRHATGKSKVIVLLTDGVNNLEKVSPELGLEIAKAYKVRVYTIGMGTMGQAPMPVPTPFGTQMQMMPVQIDEALLQKIARETGGIYYRATGNNSLASIYKQIDKLEKTKVAITSYKQYAELFFPFALMALAALFLEMLLRYTIFRSIT